VGLHVVREAGNGLPQSEHWPQSAFDRTLRVLPHAEGISQEGSTRSGAAIAVAGTRLEPPNSRQRRNDFVLNSPDLWDDLIGELQNI
jgi:hypothetical protein